MADDTATDDTISLPEAARRIGVNARTLQRREQELHQVGSMKTGSGWRILVDQVETLADLVSTTRQTTTDTPTPRLATTDMRQKTEVTHVRCRERETELRIELAEARAAITELRAQVSDLAETKASLLEQNAQATAANAAMAMSLRETIQRIENAPHEDKASMPETDVAPHHTGGGLRTRFARLFS